MAARVYFDLIGLPPTPEQTARFLSACENSGGQCEAVYEAEVDRLLNSPHYGERWAAVWMDLARFADTKGFEKDPHRDIWPYRDWVIRAFNQNLPFDQFTIKQLAGDLLPQPDVDDLVATAFHRNTQTNTEGGTDDEEFRVSAVIDRINTTWTVWQATTFGCVQCHSHPYDPFQHSEFYAFMAFFNSTEDHDLDDDFPTMSLPDSREQAALAVKLDQQRNELRQSLNDVGLPLAAEADQWTALAPTKVESSQGQLKTELNHQVHVAGGTFPPGCIYTVHTPAKNMTALRVQILPESDDAASWPETGSVLSKLELTLELSDGQIQDLPLADVFADYLAGPYNARDAMHDGAAGFGGYPKLTGPRWAVFVLDQPLEAPAGATLVIRLKQDAQTTGSRAVHLRRFQLDSSALPAWTEVAHSAERAAQWQRYQQLADQRKQLTGPDLPIMQQRTGAAARPTRVFVRGNWLDLGELVSPAVPSILPAIDAPQSDRLALARWLVSDRNPLTAQRLGEPVVGAAIRHRDR